MDWPGIKPLLTGLECIGMGKRYDHKLDDKNYVSMKSTTEYIPYDDDDDDDDDDDVCG